MHTHTHTMIGGPTQARVVYEMAVWMPFKTLTQILIRSSQLQLLRLNTNFNTPTDKEGFNFCTKSTFLSQHKEKWVSSLIIYSGQLSTLNIHQQCIDLSEIRVYNHWIVNLEKSFQLFSLPASFYKWGNLNSFTQPVSLKIRIKIQILLYSSFCFPVWGLLIKNCKILKKYWEKMLEFYLQKSPTLRDASFS